jgi:hypothetical protein
MINSGSIGGKLPSQDTKTVREPDGAFVILFGLDNPDSFYIFAPILVPGFVSGIKRESGVNPEQFPLL